MIITKLFEVESAHIVRNCTSERCSHSIHGHSAKIEVSFKSSTLDNAQMVMDFGLMKNEIKKYIDSMDHCYLLCSKDNEDFKNFIKAQCDRWIELPFNPSAEMLSMFIMDGINRILCSMKFNNGENSVECIQVRYWETRTGSATCDQHDVQKLYIEPEYFHNIKYSDGVVRDWNSSQMEQIFLHYKCSEITNPIIEQQIKLK